ncbi:hypothetical protein VKT23_007183 [Stygiomarasmius scandens]|uniref:Ubiquitin-like protease family profile domain-containing protein n=1 Tax=Marasmiellus scandens TaxID=2682957 RepID=A0ABR1JPV0_9AGAR
MPVKRPAVDALQRPSKQRRTANQHSPNEQGIVTRWVKVGSDIIQLSRDTLFGRPKQSDPQIILVSSQSPSPPPTPSTSPSIPFSSRARRRNPVGSMGPPPTPPPRVLFPDSSSEASSSRPSTPNRSQVESALSSHSYPHVVKRNYNNRQHIHSSSHKKSVAETRKKDLEEMQRKVYELKKSQGFTSDFKDFQSFIDYGASLQAANERSILSPSPSLTNLRETPLLFEPSRTRRHSDADKDTFLRRHLEIALKAFKGPKPPLPFIPSLEQLRRRARNRDEAIEQHLRPKRIPLPSSLPPPDDAQVTAFFKHRGVISKYAKEQVSDTDLVRLKPGSWLNDEIINFYGALLLGRSEASKENNTKKGEMNGIQSGRKTTPLDIHYFNTFFWTKLEKDGYEKSRLAKWTKKIDIFSKDIVIIPVNHNNMHWTGAAINFRRKRIESYDSMGMDRSMVYKRLRNYLDAEHKNKKKTPFDFTDWVDYTLNDTPQQENGYDCGVFTCQFLESLSRGEESFNFTQKDIPYLRRKMVWEIGNARLRDDP